MKIKLLLSTLCLSLVFACSHKYTNNSSSNPLDGPYTSIAKNTAKEQGDKLTDEDNDGVPDKLDRSPNTPAGAPVDSHGVTLDSDNDGVPNYEDSEPFSPPGYETDPKGVAQVPPPKSVDLSNYITKDQLGSLAPTPGQPTGHAPPPPPPPVIPAAEETYSSITENDYKAVKEEALSTFSIDVDRASYANVRRFINDNQKPPAKAVRVEEMINYFDYDYPQPQSEHPFEVVTELSVCPWDKTHLLAHIGLQGRNIDWEKAPNSNLVFLLDVSGSMGNDDKLPLLKSALKMLVNNLRDEDRVAIVVYAGAAGVVLESTSGNKKQKIIDALEELNAGGSTAGGQGIKLAYEIAKKSFIKNGNNRILLATDGDFNVGVSSQEDLENLITEKREDDIFLTVLGFGTGNYRDDVAETLADKGNGNYAYIDNILEAKKVLVSEMGGTLYTIAKDVKIQVEFNPVYAQSYRLIGYENRTLAKEDFNDDKKDAGELGAGHTVTALYEIIPVNAAKQPVSSVDPLKYQTSSTTPQAQKSGELMTVKLRYKQPTGDVSQLLVHPVVNEPLSLANTSENYRFAAAAAGFGLLLRNSKYKGNLTFDKVLEMAKSAKGKDEEGYRAEMIRLVETCGLLFAED